MCDYTRYQGSEITVDLNKAKKKNSCVSGSRLEKNRVGRSILLFFFFYFFFFVTSGPTHQSAFCITD